jgi:hypothetical protein
MERLPRHKGRTQWHNQEATGGVLSIQIEAGALSYALSALEHRADEMTGPVHEIWAQAVEDMRSTFENAVKNHNRYQQEQEGGR